MRKKVIIIGSVLIMLILALFLKEYVRHWFLIPIIELFGLTKDIPQLVIWIFFISALLIPAFKSIDKWNIPILKGHEEKGPNRGRIETVALLLRHAHASRGYFRKRLSAYMGGLTLEILAYREKLSYKVLEERLKEGKLKLPSDINDYLKAGLLGDITKKTSLNLDPVRIVEFLEQQLEVKNDINDQ